MKTIIVVKQHLAPGGPDHLGHFGADLLQELEGVREGHDTLADWVAGQIRRPGGDFK